MREILIVGGMALAVYLLMGGKVKAAPQYSAAYGATEIMNVGGWRYFTDGTAIGPDGAYYSHGAQVTGPQVPAAWSPSAAQGNGLVYP